MPRATRSRLRGWRFDASIAPGGVFAADSSPRPSRATRGGASQPVEVGGILDQAGQHQLHDPLLAQALDVHATPRGEMDDPLHALGRAVDVGAVGVALAGEADERFPARRAGVREPPRALAALRARPGWSRTGPTTSGMTSPALCTRTMSPGRTSFSRTWSSLCRVASCTVEPPTKTGDSRANGVARPVLADRDHDVDQPCRPAPRARILEGDGPARGPRGVAEPGGASVRSSTFTTTPSILVGEVVAVLLEPSRAAGQHRVDAAHAARRPD